MEKKNPKLDQAIIKMVQSHDKLEKQLGAANAKIEAIKKALPDYRIMGGWGSGAKMFVQKIRTIIDAP